MNRIEWAPAALTAANTSRDGTGSNVATVFSADEETWLEKLTFQAAGSNVDTVARIFVNNGKPSATASNNVLVKEVTLPTTTASAVAALTLVEASLRIYLPAGYCILVTLGTAVSAGYYVAAFAGDYWRQQARV